LALLRPDVTPAQVNPGKYCFPTLQIKDSLFPHQGGLSLQ
jgi:hypothetical protein